MSNAIENRQWTDEEIRAQLGRILAHPEFRATDKMRDFLQFVVEETLAGNARHLKGFTIAMAVFGRDESFDAAHDPVVRIQAGRLRRAMERYYLIAGGADPIQIDIPKGSYVPVFRSGFQMGAQSPSHAEPEVENHFQYPTWPSLLVRPFEDLTERSDLSHLAVGLATDLSMELAGAGDLRVMLHHEAFNMDSEEAQRPDFMVQGSIRAEGATIKVVIQLLGAASHELLWTDSMKSELEDGRLIEFQERTAAAIAAHIAGQHGAIFRAMTGATSRRLRACSDSYGAILKGHAYQQRFDPESYQAAFEALSEAHQRDPGCGLVCSMLAVLHVDNMSLEFFDPGRMTLAKTLALARDGVSLEPQNQLCRLVLARAHLLNDDLMAGLRELNAAQALSPGSILFMDVIGYLRALLGEWDNGTRQINEAMRLNPFYRAYTRFAIWANCLRHGDYGAALEEARWLRGVGFFWAPLTDAATLGLLGRVEAGRAAVDRLLELKPDFPERGLVLIRHFIKFPELEDTIVEGLARSGLLVASDEPVRKPG